MGRGRGGGASGEGVFIGLKMVLLQAAKDLMVVEA